MKYRVGIGYDVHRLEKGPDFYLGGIKIIHSKGAVGHSDADTLIHAICDALLGAANAGDIGIHFPDTSKEFDGIDSKKLLSNVIEIISKKGYSIENVDSIIILQKPKISEYIPQMKKVLATTMKIDIDDISVKATTTEKLGYIGREEGIAAQAVVLLSKNNA